MSAMSTLVDAGVGRRGGAAAAVDPDAQAAAEAHVDLPQGEVVDAAEEHPVHRRTGDLHVLHFDVGGAPGVDGRGVGGDGAGRVDGAADVQDGPRPTPTPRLQGT
ncbi:hypothetical protein GCM10023220_49640 [Streptomyces ziwulingensis]|uniref:Uncharacterized protein n=1 Tax=Streptomyces ziwulingensis TaxID=1045501 RepID=A0ABP9CJC0_9ACTN